VTLQTKIFHAIFHQGGAMVDVAMIAALLDVPSHTVVVATKTMIPTMIDHEREIGDVSPRYHAIVFTFLTRSRGSS